MNENEKTLTAIAATLLMTMSKTCAGVEGYTEMSGREAVQQVLDQAQIKPGPGEFMEIVFTTTSAILNIEEFHAERVGSDPRD